MNNSLIIVAGGKGSRMGTDLPKQFLELNGKPLLFETMRRFYEWNPNLEIILVMHKDYIQYWVELGRTLNFTIPHEMVIGGEERFHSVKAGLEKIKTTTGIVGVHDAARPLVSKKVIETSFNSARINGTAVPVLPIQDSIRLVENGKSETADRSRFRLVQTPQCFEISLLKKAYEQGYHPRFTDDASVVESLGVQLHLVEGNRENFKITTPEDLRLANVMLAFD